MSRLKIAHQLLRLAKSIVGLERPMPYKELNDAAENEEVRQQFRSSLEPGRTEIWYMKPKAFRNLNMGYDFMTEHVNPDDWPDTRNLKKTHVLLGKISEGAPNKIYKVMQGEIWSPYGEANDLIRSKGLHHTSMSIGDIIKIGGEVLMVDRVGFKELF